MAKPAKPVFNIPLVQNAGVDAILILKYLKYPDPYPQCVTLYSVTFALHPT